MAINVTIGESKTQEAKPFPKLMKFTEHNTIVFLEKHSCGMIINADGFYQGCVGYATNFPMELLVDFNEPITLQNQ